jgi:hypothetical protein
VSWIQWLQALVSVFQGLLTPVVAVSVAYIAYQQWKTNERRLVLDRYERRLRVFRRVVEFLNLSLRDFKPEPMEVARFRSDAAEADFLFGPEIPAYIAEVSKQALESWALHREYRDYTQVPPEGYNHLKVVDGMHERSVWLTEQHDVAREKFRKYLDVSR